MDETDLHDDTEAEDGEAPENPLVRRALISAANYLHCLVSDGDDWASDYLPPRYKRYYNTPDFKAAFCICISQVAQKIESSTDFFLSCTAEELALRMIVEEAKRMVEDEPDTAFDPHSDTAFQIDDPDALSEDIDDWYDRVIEDEDITFLYDKDFDPKDNGPVAQQLGFTNLSIEDWFVSFNPKVADIHPFVRGFVPKKPKPVKKRSRPT